MRKFILFSILILLLNSCNFDLKNIEINGKIIDKQTNESIANSEVIARIWYTVNIDEDDFIIKKTLTDLNGNYSFIFDKGHTVDVASKYNGYNPIKIRQKLNSEKTEINLNLNKEVNVSNIIVNLLYGHNKPYIRQRIYSNLNKLDFENIEIWGYDFSKSKNTNNLDNSDVFLKPNKNEIFPTVLLSNKKGGIIPIFDYEYNYSLLFEKTKAPVEGYVTSYKLKGNEAGFFIKCRDGLTYGKLILDSKTNISSPYKKGFYKEWGYSFKSLYIPNGELEFNYIWNRKLEDFL